MSVSISDLSWAIASVLGLVALNAAFVAAEFSLVTLRFTRFQSAEQERANKRARFVRLLARLGPTLKIIRLGVTSCTMGLGFVLSGIALKFLSRAEVSLESWTALGVASVSFVGAVAMMFIVGELVPRALAMQHPVKTLTWSSWVVSVFRVVTGPLLFLLDGFSSRLLRAFSIDSSVDLNLLDVEAQIRSLVSGADELPPIAETLLHNVLAMRKRVAQDILLPRNRIVYLDLYDGADANIQLARKSGHTRFPLCEGDLDHCIGLIHIKDVFRSSEDPKRIDLRNLRREVMRIPSEEPLESVLQRMLRLRVHFTLVVDEFGGTIGAITLENVLEELVGDILDEFDKEEALIRPGEDGVFLVDGLAPLHDVNESLGVDLSTDDVSTFGGFITNSLGAMPRQNVPIRLGPVEIVVTHMTERRIVTTQVKVVGTALVEDDSEARPA